jgi:Protein of unknown function (DUF998)
MSEITLSDRSRRAAGTRVDTSANAVAGASASDVAGTSASDIADTAVDTPGCDRRTAVTRSLLGYGVIVGPLYTVASLAQALRRNGFQLARHQWSLLETGALGWIQSINFVVCGAVLVAFAAGLRRVPAPAGGSRWAARLTAVFGSCLAAAGVFTADPALGFPVGTPDGPGQVSWHGLLHFTAAGIGFSAIAASCSVLARRYAADGRRSFARYCRVTGSVFLAGFACVASGAGLPAANLIFVAAVIWLWAWVSVVALDLYRSARPTLA